LVRKSAGELPIRPMRFRDVQMPEAVMATNSEHERNKAARTPHTQGDSPQHRGGDHIRKAQEWGGGNKASKGPVTPADKKNQNSSAKS
jgi:hypothetical protein